MSNRKLAEKFANGAVCGNGSHLFIEGDTIYSYGYNFAVARRTGEKTANLTTRKYSQSTSVHTGYIRTALVRAGYSITLTDNPSIQ